MTTVTWQGLHHLLRAVDHHQQDRDATDGTVPWIEEAVAGSGTAFSAPATTYNSIGNLVTAAGPGNSLLFYWQHSESGPFNREQVAPPGSIA